MGTELFRNSFEAVSMLVFSVGFSMLFLSKNLIKKIIGFNFMDNGIFLFLAAKGYITGRMSPIITDGVTAAENYVNPIPAGLVLTGIVVSVSVMAFLLSLAVRLHGRYGTLNMDELIALSEKEADV